MLTRVEWNTEKWKELGWKSWKKWGHIQYIVLLATAENWIPACLLSLPLVACCLAKLIKGALLAVQLWQLVLYTYELSHDKSKCSVEEASALWRKQALCRGSKRSVEEASALWRKHVLCGGSMCTEAVLPRSYQSLRTQYHRSPAAGVPTAEIGSSLVGTMQPSSHHWQVCRLSDCLCGLHTRHSWSPGTKCSLKTHYIQQSKFQTLNIGQHTQGYFRCCWTIE